MVCAEEEEGEEEGDAVIACLYLYILIVHVLK